MNHSDANFSNKQPHETNNEANQDTPVIECHDKGGGNMICRWTDNEGSEHALYYNKQTEFLRFNRDNKQWVALLKNTETSFSSTDKKLALDRASRDGANVPAEARHPQDCEGFHEVLGCPEIINQGGVTYYRYTQQGDWLIINPKTETVEWGPADRKYVPVFINLG